MKFLLDVGISPELGRLLESIGHSFRFVPDHYSSKSSDAEILNIAAENGEVVITHDLDFGMLLAFSRQAMPSVVLFRIHKISPSRFFALMTANWSVIDWPLQEGSFVVFDENGLRIRRLPI